MFTLEHKLTVEYLKKKNVLKAYKVYFGFCET